MTHVKPDKLVPEIIHSLHILIRKPEPEIDSGCLYFAIFITECFYTSMHVLRSWQQAGWECPGACTERWTHRWTVRSSTHWLGTYRMIDWGTAETIAQSYPVHIKSALNKSMPKRYSIKFPFTVLTVLWTNTKHLAHIIVTNNRNSQYTKYAILYISINSIRQQTWKTCIDSNE